LQKDRLLSLDVFRGITIAAMILVNTPGSWSYIYSPLMHSEWNGCTPTDLIFPFFLFMVGVAVSISSPKNGKERSKVTLKILKRSLYLFLIGLFLNGFPYYELEAIRIMGVLQRIALVFLVIALLHHYVNFKTQIKIGVGLLVLYWLVMLYVPVPGFGNANLDPSTNFSAWFDRIFLSGHMWRLSETWDPEGLFSTLPAIVTGLLGMIAGNLIFKSENKENALIQLFVLANGLIVLALAWGLIFPINKSLWTSSYVLYSGGIAIHFFAALYWLLDIERIGNSKVKVFKVFGSNAIVVYTLSGILAVTLDEVSIGSQSIKEHIYQFVLTIFGDPYLSSLVFALLFVTLCYLPIHMMCKNKIFIKI
jgi:predicted acyltransferase